ncbi:MAG: DUF58 domain-containing protein [Gemmatimonadaceae bacterium]|nr:DUF58 domain-containing protein [Gemmatimonadaceae bacterium]
MATPGLHDYGALLDALRGVRWNARMRPRTTNVGAHTAKRIGPNVEVTEYRPYRQGDDPRRLDWKLLARTDRAYVRLAPDIATSPTLIVLDGSASMGAAVGGASKWRQARMLCVGLAAVGRGAGDPVGLVIALGRGARRLAPRARGDVVREMIRVVDGLDVDGSAALAPLLEGMRGIERVVVISDLLGDADALLRRGASLIARGIEVIIVHLVARDEMSLRVERAVAVDPEDAALRRPLARSAHRAYDANFAAFRTSMRNRWLATGARYVEILDDQPSADAVRTLVRAASGSGAVA